jgi:hypothetical protein
MGGAENWILTSGALSVFLDVLALADELVFGGAGKTALHRSAQLRSEARGGAGKLSSSKHCERSGFVFNVWIVYNGADYEIRSYSN